MWTFIFGGRAVQLCTVQNQFFSGFVLQDLIPYARYFSTM
jgi:hypothetical protein